MWTERDINRPDLSLIALATLVLAGSVAGQVVLDNPPEFAGVGIEEHLGEKLPLDLAFTDDHGRPVTLQEFLGQGKPVVLNMVYYQCPMLCNLVLNGVTNAVKQIGWIPGEQFRMVAISINPRETYDLAAAKKLSYLTELSRPEAEAGWSFLVGTEANSKALAESLGFHYRYDSESKEFVHTAATFILTPDGTISRYLYGIEYNPRDLKLALLEASEGKTGSTLDRLILYCYHYDPQAKGYVLFAENVMKVGGGLTALLLGLALFILWRRERSAPRPVHLAVRRPH
ncbi:MAG: SCO family protein [Candidatus Zixiibacteriota bacterium]